MYFWKICCPTGVLHLLIRMETLAVVHPFDHLKNSYNLNIYASIFVIFFYFEEKISLLSFFHEKSSFNPLFRKVRIGENRLKIHVSKSPPQEKIEQLIFESSFLQGIFTKLCPIRIPSNCPSSPFF